MHNDRVNCITYRVRLDTAPGLRERRVPCDVVHSDPCLIGISSAETILSREVAMLYAFLDHITLAAVLLHGTLGILDDGPFLIAALGVAFAALCFVGYLFTS